jgi:uncharacterized membrane protein YdjX (TVP38/TMEM64 family)
MDADADVLASMQAIVAENYGLAALFYVVATVICCVFLALPGVTFALFAGVMFGPIVGTLLCLVATTIGASLAFLAGRWFLRDAVKPMIEKNRYLKKMLFDDAERSGMLLLLISRLLPIFPYNLQNFAYGVTDIGFWPYTFYTFVFLTPGVTFFTIGAAGLAVRGNRIIYFLVSGLLAVCVVLTGLYLRRRYLKHIL